VFGGLDPAIISIGQASIDTINVDGTGVSQPGFVYVGDDGTSVNTGTLLINGGKLAPRNFLAIGEISGSIGTL